MAADPLVEEGSYTKGEARVKRGVAKFRLDMLAELDVSRIKRAELAASGVKESRIDALYPFDFGDYIEGIIPLISSEKLYSITSADSMRHLTRDVEALTNFTTAAGKALLRQQNSSGFKVKMTQLAIAIDRCLPVHEAGEIEEAKMLAIMLWHSMTFSAHPELVESEVQANNLFLDITYLLLPHLHAQESALIAQLAELEGERA